LATSESNRALPPYQDGPFDRLGRGQRKVEVSIFQAAKPARVFKARCRAGAPSMAEDGAHDAQRLSGAHTASNRSRRPGRFILQARKAGYSKATVLPAHPLATEPGALPVHLP
jgi:hypothetical protein